LPVMSVAQLQRIIRRLSAEDRRSLAVVAARMVRSRQPVRRPANAKTMLSVLGCARKVQPRKNSRQILAEMRGYERGEL